MTLRAKFTLKRAGGFSLVELLTVVAVAGTLSAVSVPSISGAMQRYRLNTASRTVMAEIRAARFAAVAKNRTMRVLFNCPGPNQFRVVEVVGTPAIDGDANRCSETDYPFPNPDPNAAPNADGPVFWLNDGVTFAGVQDLQISTRGRVQPLTNCPACAVAATPATIGLSNGHAEHAITVSASGMVTQSQ